MIILYHIILVSDKLIQRRIVLTFSQVSPFLVRSKLSVENKYNAQISLFATIFPKVVCCRGVTNGLDVGKGLYLSFIFLNISE